MSRRRPALLDAARARRERWRVRAPDGRPRPDAPFGRGPLAARVLGHVIDVAASVGSRLPAAVTHPLAVVGGHVEWAARAGKRRRLAANLGHAIGAPADSPEVRRLVRRELVNEARRSADLLWAIGRPDELLATLDVVGTQHVERAAARGCGVVLAGIHLGGWEVVTAAPARVVPVPTNVVVADNWLAWAIQHVRVDVGLRITYRSESALAPARMLRRGEALLILGDDASDGAMARHTARRTVRFCDAWADLPAGVVTLARLARSPIVPFAVVPLSRRRWQIRLEPAIEPPPRHGRVDGEQQVMQAVADRWTAMIAAHPDHWAASFPIAWRDAP